MMHGGQIVTRPWEAGLIEKIERHAKEGEDYMDRESSELGLAMVKCIYREQQEQERPRCRRGRTAAAFVRSRCATRAEG